MASATMRMQKERGDLRLLEEEYSVMLLALVVVVISRKVKVPL